MLRGMKSVASAALLAKHGQVTAPAVLTAAVTCVRRDLPAACLEALVGAGVQDLAVICLCPAALEGPILALGRALLRRNALQSFTCLPLSAGQSPRVAVNSLVAAAAAPFLLLLSADVLLEKNSLPPMLERLQDDDRLAGRQSLAACRGAFFRPGFNRASRLSSGQRGRQLWTIAVFI